MFKALMGGGRSSSTTSSSKTSSRHRTSSKTSSTVSRKSARGDDRDRDRGLGDLATYSSSGSRSRRYAPSAVTESVASSYATADQGIPGNPGDYTRYSVERIPRSGDIYEGSGRDRYSDIRDRDGRSSHRRDRDRSPSRERERPRPERADRAQWEDEFVGSRDRYRERSRAQSGDPYRPPLSTEAPVSTSMPAPPNHPAVYDPHIQQQFPGQFPAFVAEPYRPPNPAGEAADYYGDQGQSVAEQPGVRPKPPSVIPNSQTHLMTASPMANPPPEPSSMGQVGAAADYYADEADLEVNPAPSQPDNPTSVSASQPLRPSTITTTAPGIAAGVAAYGIESGLPTPAAVPASQPPRPSTITTTAPGIAAGVAAYGIESGFPTVPPVPASQPPRPSTITTTAPGIAAGIAAYGIESGLPTPAAVPASQPPRPSTITTAAPGIAAGVAAYGVESGFFTPAAGPASPPAPAEPVSAAYVPPVTSSTTKPPHSHGVGAAVGAAAVGAAAGYMLGHQQHYSMSSTDHLSQYTMQNYDESSQSGIGYPGPSMYNPPANPAWYAAGAAGLGALPYAASPLHPHHAAVHHGSPFQSGSLAFQQRQRGPLDKFIDFWRDPEGVGMFEDYTETIGVCKYCFEPGTTSRDAPRKHHYNPRRVSAERYGGGSRVDKTSRYTSSEDEGRRRKMASRNSWLPGLLGGYAVKTLFSNKDFEDTYNVRSNRVVTSTHEDEGVSTARRSQNSRGAYRRRSRSRDHDGRSVYSESRKSHYEGKRPRSRSRSRSSSRTSRHSALRDAALGAAVGSAAMAVSESRDRSRRNRSRTRSPRKTKSRKSSSSDSSSFVDISQPAATSVGGGLASFFTASSENRRTKRHSKKRRSIFSFTNSSSSSLDADLAFGSGFARKPAGRSTRKSNNKKDHDVDAALLGLGAAATALAATSDRRSRRTGEILVAKHSRSRHSDYTSSATNDEDWEDVDSGDQSSSSVSSALAFGESALFGSDDSQSSDSSTSKWGWGWGSKKDKKKKKKTASSSDGRFPTNAALAAGAIGTAALASTYHKGSRVSQSSSSGSLQHVVPVPTSDPTRFDAINALSSFPPAEPALVRPGPIPLQQPQPFAPVSQAVYATQVESIPAYSAPAVPYAFPPAFPPTFPPTYPTSYVPYRPERSQNVALGFDRPHRRSDSSPVFHTESLEGAPTPGMKRRSTAKDQASVQFDLTEEQADKERRSDLLEQLKREAAPLNGVQLIDREYDLAIRDANSRSSRRYRDREYEDRSREDLPDRDRQPKDSGKEKDTSSWIGAVAAGTIGAAAAATALSGRSSVDEFSETSQQRHNERRDKRRAERRRGSEPESTVSSRRSETAPEVTDAHPSEKRQPERSKSSSPCCPHVYDDYAQFFAPEELRHSPDTYTRREPTTMPTIVEIEPASEKRSREPSLSPEEPHPVRRDLPWPVPVLNLIEPTPPQSLSGSVRDVTSPVVHPRRLPQEEDVAPAERQTTGSRVSWGKHETHEYEVPSTSSELESVDHDTARERQEESRSPTAEVPDAPKPVADAVDADIEFAAAVAAATAAAGFDPALVTGIPAYHPRPSPPGSRGGVRFRSPWVEDELDSRTPHGFVEGEVDTSEDEEKQPSAALKQQPLHSEPDPLSTERENQERPRTQNRTSIAQEVIDRLNGKKAELTWEKAPADLEQKPQPGNKCDDSDSLTRDEFSMPGAFESPTEPKREDSRDAPKDDYRSVASAPVAGSSPSRFGKSRQDSGEFDDAEDVAPDDAEGKKKRRKRRSKRDSDAFTDSVSVTSSPAKIEDVAKPKGTDDKDTEKKLGGILSNVFGSGISESEVERAEHAESRSEEKPPRRRSSSSGDKDSQPDEASDSDKENSTARDKDGIDIESYDSNRQRREGRRRRRYEDIMESGKSAEYEKDRKVSEDNDEDQSFLGEGPEMPVQVDDSDRESGASGRVPLTGAAVAGLGINVLDEWSRGRSVSSSASERAKSPSRPTSPEATLEEASSQGQSSRRSSMFRPTESPTAVPLTFRRPPSSPGTNRSPSVGAPAAQSPGSPSAGRQRRPTSMEFKNSREIRPLWLVERHGRENAEQDPEEPLPPLPSSATSSAHNSVEDLTALQDERSWEIVDLSHHVRDTRPAGGIDVSQSRDLENDVFGSPQVTPTAATFGPIHPHPPARKEHLKYEFHSPSELLQDPSAYAELPQSPDMGDLPSAEGSAVGVKGAHVEAEDAAARGPDALPSRPSTPQDKEIPDLEDTETTPTQTRSIPVADMDSQKGSGSVEVVGAAVDAGLDAQTIFPSSDKDGEAGAQGDVHQAEKSMAVNDEADASAADMATPVLSDATLPSSETDKLASTPTADSPHVPATVDAAVISSDEKIDVVRDLEQPDAVKEPEHEGAAPDEKKGLEASQPEPPLENPEPSPQISQVDEEHKTDTTAHESSPVDDKRRDSVDTVVPATEQSPHEIEKQGTDVVDPATTEEPPAHPLETTDKNASGAGQIQPEEPPAGPAMPSSSSAKKKRKNKKKRQSMDAGSQKPATPVEDSKGGQEDVEKEAQIENITANVVSLTEPAFAEQVPVEQPPTVEEPVALDPNPVDDVVDTERAVEAPDVTKPLPVDTVVDTEQATEAPDVTKPLSVDVVADKEQAAEAPDVTNPPLVDAVADKEQAAEALVTKPPPVDAVVDMEQAAEAPDVTKPLPVDVVDTTTEQAVEAPNVTKPPPVDAVDTEQATEAPDVTTSLPVDAGVRTEQATEAPDVTKLLPVDAVDTEQAAEALDVTNPPPVDAVLDKEQVTDAPDVAKPFEVEPEVLPAAEMPAEPSAEVPAESAETTTSKKSKKKKKKKNKGSTPDEGTREPIPTEPLESSIVTSQGYVDKLADSTVDSIQPAEEMSKPSEEGAVTVPEETGEFELVNKETDTLEESPATAPQDISQPGESPERPAEPEAEAKELSLPGEEVQGSNTEPTSEQVSESTQIPSPDGEAVRGESVAEPAAANETVSQALHEEEVSTVEQKEGEPQPSDPKSEEQPNEEETEETQLQPLGQEQTDAAKTSAKAEISTAAPDVSPSGQHEEQQVETSAPANPPTSTEQVGVPSGSLQDEVSTPAVEPETPLSRKGSKKNKKKNKRKSTAEEPVESEPADTTPLTSSAKALPESRAEATDTEEEPQAKSAEEPVEEATATDLQKNTIVESSQDTATGVVDDVQPALVEEIQGTTTEPVEEQPKKNDKKNKNNGKSTALSEFLPESKSEMKVEDPPAVEAAETPLPQTSGEVTTAVASQEPPETNITEQPAGIEDATVSAAGENEANPPVGNDEANGGEPHVSDPSEQLNIKAMPEPEAKPEAGETTPVGKKGKKNKKRKQSVSSSPDEATTSELASTKDAADSAADPSVSEEPSPNIDKEPAQEEASEGLPTTEATAEAALETPVEQTTTEAPVPMTPAQKKKAKKERKKKRQSALLDETPAESIEEAGSKDTSQEDVQQALTSEGRSDAQQPETSGDTAAEQQLTTAEPLPEQPKEDTSVPSEPSPVPDEEFVMVSEHPQPEAQEPAAEGGDPVPVNTDGEKEQLTGEVAANADNAAPIETQTAESGPASEEVSVPPAVDEAAAEKPMGADQTPLGDSPAPEEKVEHGETSNEELTAERAQGEATSVEDTQPLDKDEAVADVEASSQDPVQEKKRQSLLDGEQASAKGGETTATPPDPVSESLNTEEPASVPSTLEEQDKSEDVPSSEAVQAPVADEAQATEHTEEAQTASVAEETQVTQSAEEKGQSLSLDDDKAPSAEEETVEPSSDPAPEMVNADEAAPVSSTLEEEQQLEAAAEEAVQEQTTDGTQAQHSAEEPQTATSEKAKEEKEKHKSLSSEDDKTPSTKEETEPSSEPVPELVNADEAVPVSSILNEEQQLEVAVPEEAVQEPAADETQAQHFTEEPQTATSKKKAKKKKKRQSTSLEDDKAPSAKEEAEPSSGPALEIVNADEAAPLSSALNEEQQLEVAAPEEAVQEETTDEKQAQTITPKEKAKKEKKKRKSVSFDVEEPSLQNSESDKPVKDHPEQVTQEGEQKPEEDPSTQHTKDDEPQPTEPPSDNLAQEKELTADNEPEQSESRAEVAEQQEQATEPTPESITGEQPDVAEELAAVPMTDERLQEEEQKDVEETSGFESNVDSVQNGHNAELAQETKEEPAAQSSPDNQENTETDAAREPTESEPQTPVDETEQGAGSAKSKKNKKKKKKKKSITDVTEDVPATPPEPANDNPLEAEKTLDTAEPDVTAFDEPVQQAEKPEEEPSGSMSAKAKRKAKKDKKRQSKVFNSANDAAGLPETAPDTSEQSPLDISRRTENDISTYVSQETSEAVSTEAKSPAPSTETAIAPAEDDGKENPSHDTELHGENDKDLTWTDHMVSSQVEQQQATSSDHPSRPALDVDINPGSEAIIDVGGDVKGADDAVPAADNGPEQSGGEGVGVEDEQPVEVSETRDGGAAEIPRREAKEEAANRGGVGEEVKSEERVDESLKEPFEVKLDGSPRQDPALDTVPDDGEAGTEDQLTGVEEVNDPPKSENGLELENEESPPSTSSKKKKKKDKKKKKAQQEAKIDETAQDFPVDVLGEELHESPGQSKVEIPIPDSEVEPTAKAPTVEFPEAKEEPAEVSEIPAEDIAVEAKATEEAPQPEGEVPPEGKDVEEAAPASSRKKSKKEKRNERLAQKAAAESQQAEQPEVEEQAVSSSSGQHIEPTILESGHAPEAPLREGLDARENELRTTEVEPLASAEDNKNPTDTIEGQITEGLPVDRGVASLDAEPAAEMTLLKAGEEEMPTEPPKEEVPSQDQEDPDVSSEPTAKKSKKDKKKTSQQEDETIEKSPETEQPSVTVGPPEEDRSPEGLPLEPVRVSKAHELPIKQEALKENPEVAPKVLSSERKPESEVEQAPKAIPGSTPLSHKESKEKKKKAKKEVQEQQEETSPPTPAEVEEVSVADIPSLADEPADLPKNESLDLPNANLPGEQGMQFDQTEQAVPLDATPVVETNEHTPNVEVQLDDLLSKGQENVRVQAESSEGLEDQDEQAAGDFMESQPGTTAPIARKLSKKEKRRAKKKSAQEPTERAEEPELRPTSESIEAPTSIIQATAEDVSEQAEGGNRPSLSPAAPTKSMADGNLRAAEVEPQSSEIQGDAADEDDWPAIDWEKGIAEFDESAIPEGLLERQCDLGTPPQKVIQPATQETELEDVQETPDMTQEKALQDFKSPIALDQAKEAINVVPPKQSKVASIFPDLERGMFRRTVSRQGLKDSAEDETTDQKADREGAIQVSEAPLAAGEPKESPSEGQGNEKPLELTTTTTIPADLAVEVEVDPSYNVSVISDRPGEETKSIEIQWEKDNHDDSTPGSQPELPLYTPLPVHEQTSALIGPSSPVGKDRNERAPSNDSSCELRRSPSIHERHNHLPRTWSPDHTPISKAVTPPPATTSLFGEPVGVPPSMGSPPRTPLQTIAEQEPEDRVEQASGTRSMGPERGTPRLEMKPEYVLPRPETPIRKFTDNALARQAWPVDKDKLGSAADEDLGLSVRKRHPGSGWPADVLKTPEQGMPILRPSSVSSVKSAQSNPSVTSGHRSLRRTSRNASGDLRAVSQAQESHSPQPHRTPQPPQPPPSDLNIERIASSSSYDPVTDKGKRPIRAMTDVYEGWGETPNSPRSPSRPPSIRHRRSMQHLQELEARLDQLISENRLLIAAREAAEDKLRNASVARRKSDHTLNERNADLRDREAEVGNLKSSVEWLQKEVARLTEENQGLVATNSNLTAAHASEILAVRGASTRQMDELRSRYEKLSTEVQKTVRLEIETALARKDGELRRLREELESARDKVTQLQQQIAASLHDNILVFRDEDYFDAACQKLCGHVQQWVLRFSKHSDHRRCRKLGELQDEKIADRFDNAILDGFDTDTYLGDRVRRRDVFMSVVMTMVWEFVFTRYLFGMDREQRQKLKSLEKQLSEVGPRSAVHRWRAITLTLLSKRPAFARQRENDTEAVALEIFATLSRLLPPPAQVEAQLLESLRKVLRVAVNLSIEMRTQLAEYIMLPPLQPEYDTNGDLARQVYFNASLMNERSGETTSNEELESKQAVVRVVLFPLVVKKGNDTGEGEEEVVVCPAQVLIARPDKDHRVSKILSNDRMSLDGNKSVHSVAPSSTMEMSNVI